MDRPLENRVVVVTGGTGFLGSAVVDSLVARGARCHITWVTEKEKERFGQRPNVELHQVDCANEAQVSAFYAGLPLLWASVHTVGGFAMGAIENTSAEQMRKMLEMNAMTTFLCCREAIRAMRKGGDGGRIVNVAARPATTPTAGMIAYATSKSAVAAMTLAMAEEVKGESIWVNAVLPSLMDTPANRKAMPDADYSKWPKVGEVAEAIAMLVSPQNALTSGALVPVYGRV
jgi:NAD(P)-dependent dehydrogenase (short-subunit alcohol dehydrogenase family)